MVETHPMDAQAAMQLTEHISGAWKSHAIHAAAALGVADVLKDGPLELEELARRLTCQVSALGRLLKALATIGVFEETPSGAFSTTALGRCLERGGMRDAFLMVHSEWHEAAWSGLVHAVRTGGSGFERAHGVDLFTWLQAHPDASDLFSRGMQAGRAYRDAGVPEAYAFSGASVVVDVGGGYGSLLLAILRAHPHLFGILCDVPDVAQAARTQIENAGMLERCAVAAVDFFQNVPPGGDVYLLAHIIHDWSDEAAQRILQKCATAMPAHGRILLVENVLPDDATPTRTRWLDLEMLVLTPGGRERTVADFRGLALAAGLRLAAVVPTAGSRAVIELVRAET